MTVQTVVSTLTSSFCSLSSAAIIALVVSVDPQVRKIAMGVIGVWFLLCVLNMSLPTEKGKSNPLVEQVKSVTSYVSGQTSSSSGTSSVLSFLTGSGSL